MENYGRNDWKNIPYSFWTLFWVWRSRERRKSFPFAFCFLSFIYGFPSTSLKYCDSLSLQKLLNFSSTILPFIIRIFLKSRELIFNFLFNYFFCKFVIAFDSLFFFFLYNSKFLQIPNSSASNLLFCKIGFWMIVFSFFFLNFAIFIFDHLNILLFNYLIPSLPHSQWINKMPIVYIINFLNYRVLHLPV